jgi:plasmid stability protein
MATLTLHDVPYELILKLQKRAREHGRSLVHEAMACLESMVQPSPAQIFVAKAPQDADRASAWARIAATRSRFPAAANPGETPWQPGDPLPPIDPATEAELAEFAEMRSWFKGPPIEEAELVAATERDSH